MTTSTETSTLAQAAKAIRADVKKTAAAGKLPPHPDGIAFQVRARRAALMEAVDIEVLNVPRSWMYEQRPGAVNRPSPAWLLLRGALERVARQHFQADGAMSFIDVATDPESVIES